MLAGASTSLPRVSRIFGLYNAMAAIAGAGGALLGALPRRPATVPVADASTATIGILFAAIGLLQTVSLVTAPLLAGRIGLLPTLVFIHLPSNQLLAAVALAPTIHIAGMLVLALACLSQMDAHTRQAYVMAIVRPDSGLPPPPP